MNQYRPASKSLRRKDKPARRLFAIAVSLTATKRKRQEDLISLSKRKLTPLFEASRQECFSTLAGEALAWLLFPPPTPTPTSYQQAGEFWFRERIPSTISSRSGVGIRSVSPDTVRSSSLVSKISSAWDCRSCAGLFIAKHRHAGAVPRSKWDLVCFR